MESESDGGESAPAVFDPDQVLVLTADGSADFDYPVCTLHKLLNLRKLLRLSW